MKTRTNYLSHCHCCGMRRIIKPLASVYVSFCRHFYSRNFTGILSWWNLAQPFVSQKVRKLSLQYPFLHLAPSFQSQNAFKGKVQLPQCAVFRVAISPLLLLCEKYNHGVLLQDTENTILQCNIIFCCTLTVVHIIMNYACCLSATGVAVRPVRRIVA